TLCHKVAPPNYAIACVAASSPALSATLWAVPLKDNPARFDSTRIAIGPSRTIRNQLSPLANRSLRLGEVSPEDIADRFVQWFRARPITRMSAPFRVSELSTEYKRIR